MLWSRELLDIYELRVYELPEGRQVQRIKISPQDCGCCASLSPDGKEVLFGGYNGEVRIWNLAKGKRIRTVQIHPPAARVAPILISPDGTTVLSSGAVMSGPPQDQEKNSGIKAWRRATGEILHSLPRSAGSLWLGGRSLQNGSGYFSQNGKRMLLNQLEEVWDAFHTQSHYKYRVVICETASGKIVDEAPVEEHAAGIGLSADGTKVWLRENVSISLWDRRRRQRLWSIRAAPRTLGVATFSADRRLLLTGWDSYHAKPGPPVIVTLTIWNAQTGARVQTLEGP